MAGGALKGHYVVNDVTVTTKKLQTPTSVFVIETSSENPT